MLFFGAIGMFGVGVGMLYTPILVDRLQLTFPSGLAVANILRALTDPVLLKRSINRLGTGMALGVAGGLGAAKLAFIGASSCPPRPSAPACSSAPASASRRSLPVCSAAR